MCALEVDIRRIGASYLPSGHSGQVRSRRGELVTNPEPYIGSRGFLTNDCEKSRLSQSGHQHDLTRRCPAPRSGKSGKCCQ